MNGKIIYRFHNNHHHEVPSPRRKNKYELRRSPHRLEYELRLKMIAAILITIIAIDLIITININAIYRRVRFGTENLGMCVDSNGMTKRLTNAIEIT